MLEYLYVIPLIFVLSSPDIQQDHKLHYVSSLAIQQVAYTYTDNVWLSAGVSLGIGIAKELIHDKIMKRGNPSWKDMKWNALGVTTGLTITIRF